MNTRPNGLHTKGQPATLREEQATTATSRAIGQVGAGFGHRGPRRRFLHGRPLGFRTIDFRTGRGLRRRPGDPWR